MLRNSCRRAATNRSIRCSHTAEVDVLVAGACDRYAPRNEEGTEELLDTNREFGNAQRQVKRSPNRLQVPYRGRDVIQVKLSDTYCFRVQMMKKVVGSNFRLERAWRVSYE